MKSAEIEVELIDLFSMVFSLNCDVKTTQKMTRNFLH